MSNSQALEHRSRPRAAVPKKSVWQRPIYLHLPTGGLVMREWRAALPSVLALAGICLLMWGIGTIGEIIKDNAIRWNVRDERLFARLWLACTAIIAALLGVLCGAEEEENATADFAFRLPIARLRILGEKILGALAAFLTWHAAFIVVVVVASFIAGLNSYDVDLFNVLGVMGKIDSEYRALTWLVGYGPLFFCFTLAAGAWIRKVIIAALAGGLAALAYGWISYRAAHVTWAYSYSLPESRPRLLFLLILIGCGAALGTAAVRYLTREGR